MAEHKAEHRFSRSEERGEEPGKDKAEAVTAQETKQDAVVILNGGEVDTRDPDAGNQNEQQRGGELEQQRAGNQE